MKKMTILLLVLALAPNLYANSSFGTKSIERIAVSDSNNLQINLSGTVEHSEGCASPGREHELFLNPDSPFLKEMYATALAAYMSGKEVSGWVNGCVSAFGLNFPKLTVITIKD